MVSAVNDAGTATPRLCTQASTSPSSSGRAASSCVANETCPRQRPGSWTSAGSCPAGASVSSGRTAASTAAARSTNAWSGWSPSRWTSWTRAVPRRLTPRFETGNAVLVRRAASTAATRAASSPATGRPPTRVACGGNAPADTKPYRVRSSPVIAVTAAHVAGSGRRNTPNRVEASTGSSSPTPRPDRALCRRGSVRHRVSCHADLRHQDRTPDAACPVGPGPSPAHGRRSARSVVSEWVRTTSTITAAPLPACVARSTRPSRGRRGSSPAPGWDRAPTPPDHEDPVLPTDPSSPTTVGAPPGRCGRSRR